MSWTTILPTATPKTGVVDVPADAVTVTIPVCAPTPPYPVFLQTIGDWQTTIAILSQTADEIVVLFGTPAPSDGTGKLSYEWEQP